MTQNRHFQPTQLRGINRDQHTVDIIASDFSVDSYGTRIDPAGWELEQFRKNPVMCLQHDAHGYSASSGLPIANAIPETVRVDNGKLVMTARFPEKGKFPVADQVFELIADGFLRGVSVGFDPSEWENAEELIDGEKRVIQVFKKQRLMEVSFVTIPSNDNALVQRAAKLNADAEVVRQKTETLEKMVAEAAPDELGKYTRDHLLKCVNYYENKQPANRAATKVLEKFYKLRGEEPPAEEAQAWEKMGEAIEAKTPVEAVAETPVEVVAETPVETVTQTTETTVEEKAIIPETTPPAPEAPEPARKASVQISLTALAELPSKLTRSYVGVAVEALQRGSPVKDAVALIDGLNEAATTSFTKP